MIPANAFPRLTSGTYQLTSPPRAWWWPDAEEVGYWPGEVARHETVAAFTQLFRSLGYEPATDAALEPGFEKVAIYALDSRPTYVARQLATGRWSSKLGPQEDIEHDFDALEGPAYGTVVAVLKRPLQDSAGRSA